MEQCTHPKLRPFVCDQTLAVECECGLFHACWQDDHIPEELWNLACVNDSDCIPTKQNRLDVCAICKKKIKKGKHAKRT